MRNKIKYQGGITKLLCQKQAERSKKKFRQLVVSGAGPFQFNQSTGIDFDVISFSGATAFEDQLLSIYSFVLYAGIPRNWIIYSDKSYTEEQKELFKKKFPFISVTDWDVYDHVSSNKHLSEYLQVCHLAKKVNIIVGHPYTRQTIYLDSDIVFYKNISGYLSSSLLSGGFWFAPDSMWGDLNGYFNIKRESIYPLNSGMLILNNDFDAADVFQYFEDIKGKYEYFSEQSSFEYAFRKQGANMLDPRQFIIDSSDQFDFAMKYYPDEIAMRHYTSPVRHKMWQKGWNWHFPAGK